MFKAGGCDAESMQKDTSCACYRGFYGFLAMLAHCHGQMDKSRLRISADRLQLSLEALNDAR